MKQKHIPYCYYIGWSTEGKYYYGVKYGQDANPDTLWKDYFTSSTYVKEMREKFGEPDIIQIRKTFNSPKEAIVWECKVLNRLDAIHKPQWLNKHNGKALYHDAEVRAKQSKAVKGRVRTKEHSEAISKATTGIKKPSLMNGKETPCPTCGEMVYRTNYQLKNDYHKYCSKECGKVGKAWRKGIKGHHS